MITSYSKGERYAPGHDDFISIQTQTLLHRFYGYTGIEMLLFLAKTAMSSELLLYLG